MRTTHVHQEENRAFVLILLSFSRCDNIFLSPNGVFYYHFKQITFNIRKQSNTSKELPGLAFIFFFLHHLTFPKGLKNVIAELMHS